MIPGKVPRKSNSRRVVRRGGKVAVIKSRDALRYLKTPYTVWVGRPSFGNVTSIPFGSKDHAVSVKAAIFYPWHTKGDLSGEMILDYLVHVGILSDDRYVKKQVWIKDYDKDNPRSVVVVEEYDTWCEFSL